MSTYAARTLLALYIKNQYKIRERFNKNDKVSFKTFGNIFHRKIFCSFFVGKSKQKTIEKIEYIKKVIKFYDKKDKNDKLEKTMSAYDRKYQANNLAHHMFVTYSKSKDKEIRENVATFLLDEKFFSRIIVEFIMKNISTDRLAKEIKNRNFMKLQQYYVRGILAERILKEKFNYEL